MDPELKSLLQNIEQGHYEGIPKLAEWLKSRGDPRAELARNVTLLDPQEIADELVKIRSMRPPHNSFFSGIAELFLVSIYPLFGVPGTANLRTDHLEAAPQTPRWWPPSAQKCLNDVEKALTTKVIPTDVARAMTNARRIKVDRLLAAFQPREQATPLSLPAPN
jgi:hypothetical protein